MICVDLRQVFLRVNLQDFGNRTGNIYYKIF